MQSLRYRHASRGVTVPLSRAGFRSTDTMAPCAHMEARGSPLECFPRPKKGASPPLAVLELLSFCYCVSIDRQPSRARPTYCLKLSGRGESAWERRYENWPPDRIYYGTFYCRTLLIVHLCLRPGLKRGETSRNERFTFAAGLVA